jgi:hypothetical protein
MSLVDGILRQSKQLIRISLGESLLARANSDLAGAMADKFQGSDWNVMIEARGAIRKHLT